MTKTKALVDLFTVQGRYHRSTHLERDWRDKRGLEDYVLSANAADTTKMIVEAIGHEQRSWSLVGPYGTGKSSFALFLTELLCIKEPTHPSVAGMRAEYSLKKLYEPVILVGKRAPIHEALSGVLADYLGSQNKTNKRKRRKVSKTEAIIELLEDVVKLAKKRRKAGVLLLMDEFGKFLEYAAQNPDSNDLILLQEVAELADRSDPPIVFVNILHTGFTQYLRAGNYVQIAEWQKVAGRLREVHFRESGSHMLKLLGQAISPHSSAKSYSRQLRGETKDVKNVQSLAEALSRLESNNLLVQAAPIHPVTSIVLPHIFMSKLAQNERSLFAFLVSAEKNGFADFLKRAQFDSKNLQFYRPDQLYDYVAGAFGSAMFLGDQSQKWVEVDNALHRISQIKKEAPEYSRAVVKTIALLDMYGKAGGLKADTATLGYAMGDSSGVEEALEDLKKKRIIHYRKQQDAWHLWEGSDVDLDECYEESKSHVGHGQMHGRLNRFLAESDKHPLVARRHFISGGSLRYFDFSVIENTREAIEEAFVHGYGQDKGNFFCLLTEDKDDYQTTKTLALEVSKGFDAKNSMTFILLPKPIVGLEFALAEYEAWKWVSEMPVLRGDRVARMEAQVRLLGARDDLKQRLGGVFSIRGHLFSPALSEWIHEGVVVGSDWTKSNKQFQKYLSEKLDKLYSDSPRMRNELVDRRQLSSQGLAARNKLLTHMTTYTGEIRLSMDGAPAQATMYDALLSASGIHRQKNKSIAASPYVFARPQKIKKTKTILASEVEHRRRWIAVWDAIREFMETTKDSPREVNELYKQLGAPPYGLLAGPLPVVLAAFCLAQEKAALFYEGLFVPEYTPEILHLLARRPDLFTVQTHKTGGSEKKLLEQLHSQLNDIDLIRNVTNESKLIEITKGLVVFHAKLHPYTKSTRNIHPTNARAVALALSKAKSPKDLLFKELPAILGCSPDSEPDLFVNRLSECLQALANNYELLLDRIGKRIYEVFNLPEEGSTKGNPLKLLCDRAKSINEYAGPANLKRFVQAAATLDDDFNDWREKLATTVVSTAPKHWTDRIETQFHTEIFTIRSSFVQLEELAAEQGVASGSTIIRIGILGESIGEQRDVVSVASGEEEQVSDLVDKLHLSISDNGLKENRLKLAALARLAQRYMDSKEE